MSVLGDFGRWFSHIMLHDDHATVTVVKGDSLWKIAEDITGDGNKWHEIANLNPGLDKDYVIQPGQKLNIPLDWK